MALRCKIGFHDYRWTYEAPQSFRQIGRCQRTQCDKTSERIAHEFGEWRYLGSDVCNQERTCARNPVHVERSTLPQLVWGTPRYQHEEDCERIAVCERNPDHKLRTIDHI